MLSSAGIRARHSLLSRVDNDEKAMEALRDAGVVLLSAEEIHGM